MPIDPLQILVFITITALIAGLTWRRCLQDTAHLNPTTSTRDDVFLAGRGLSWIVVAGSITLTNLSTDQLVGMNGNQMALLAWWELSAVVGLIILAKVILPVYYRYQCTTTTELLEKRYDDYRIRALIGLLFLLGNLFIFIPAMLYSGALFMQTLFNVELPIIVIATAFAVVGAAYAVLGGLRAVAISDAYSGVLLLSLGMVVVFLALAAIDFDFSGIPTERLTLIGSNDSPIPWHTLLTGMLFIQIFYWGTNQTITQRAMASPTAEEGQKGVIAAAAIRLLIIPPHGRHTRHRLFQALWRYWRCRFWQDCGRGAATLAIRRLRSRHCRRRTDQRKQCFKLIHRIVRLRHSRALHCTRTQPPATQSDHNR